MTTRLHPLPLILLACSALPLHAGESISEARPVAADAVISIELLRGQVTISGHDAAVISIEGTLSDAADGFTLREANGNFHFEEIIPSGHSRWWLPGRDADAGSGALLDIRVPRNSVLRFAGTHTDVELGNLGGNTSVEIVNGSISASRLYGLTRLKTINGSIASELLSGRVTLETLNGSITDRNSTASRIRFSALNGSIYSDTRSPHVSASNVTGAITLDLHNLDELEVSTVSGALDIFGILNEAAQAELSSVSGRVELHLPLSTSASIHVSTAVGGRISNELSQAEAQQKNRYVNSRELDFAINGGRGNVNISTVSGSISLHACSPDEC